MAKLQSPTQWIATVTNGWAKVGWPLQTAIGALMGFCGVVVQFLWISKARFDTSALAPKSSAGPTARTATVQASVILYVFKFDLKPENPPQNTIKMSENGQVVIPPGKQPHSYGKSPFFIGKSTISMAIFNSYVTNYQRVNHLFGDLRNKKLRFCAKPSSVGGTPF